MIKIVSRFFLLSTLWIDFDFDFELNWRSAAATEGIAAAANL